jgi:DDE family transposase
MTSRTDRQNVELAHQIDLPPPPELEPFIQTAPLPVLVRSCLEWLIDDASLERLFDETAEQQYTRELTLGFMVDLMLDVACGIQPSASAALKAYREQMNVSRQAFYGKLNRMEPAVSAAIVKHVADRANAIIEQLEVGEAEAIPGYRVRIVDGTYMGGRTEHRIKPLRKTNSAGLTSMAIAVFEPGSRTVQQVIPQEDAYTQERALLDQLDIDAGQLWIGDRNFCVRSFLFRLHRAQSAFVVRWHGSSCPYEEIEPLHSARGTRQGALEHHVRLQDPKSHEWLKVRRIVLPLEKPTRNGDTELILVTDLPETAAVDTLFDLYRDRWTIETHYQRLTEQLHCEPTGLNHPRAALFAFAMAATAGNALAVVQKALEGQHGRQAVQELSYYQMVLEIAQTWVGMAIAVPAHRWDFVRKLTPERLACWLGFVAKIVPMAHFKRSQRGPKKPQPKRQSGKYNQHVSNKRLLDLEKLKSAC